MQLSPRKKRREQQRESTRRAILEIAREILITEGSDAFAMRKLADAAGYSVGAIYLHFETKKALFDALVEDAFAKLQEILNEAHDHQDSVQSLRNKLRAYIDFGLRFPNHYHLAFVRRPTPQKANQKTRPHSAFQTLRDAVHRCIDQEQFRSDDGERTSQILWANIHGITSLLIALPGFPWVDQADLIDHVINTGIDGLVVPQGRGQQERGQS